MLAATWWLSALAVMAQTKWITVGKYEAHPTRILAKYADRVTVESSVTTLSTLGLTVASRYELVPNLVVLDVKGNGGLAPAAVADPAVQSQQLLDRIAALRDSGLFEYVEPDYVQRAYLDPNDTRYVDGTLWGLRNLGNNGGKVGADIGAPAAWDITTGSTNVIVAVIDTGIRYTHQELRNQMWHDPTSTNTIIYGTNAVYGTSDPFDDNNHGTHVSGTIGAGANDGFPHVGINWHIQLMGCKFLGGDGSGVTSDAISCINFAVKHGAKVLNNSWGGGPFEQSLFDSINAARTNGVLFVAAAGNDANNNDTAPSYPASYHLDNIIAVAALDRADNLAFFSNYGLTNVHLGAPGVEIFSSTADADNSYDVFEGTSMATPHVTGVAALILSKYTNASVTEVRERILLTTVPVPALQGYSSTGGRVNAFNALSANPDGVLKLSVTPAPGEVLLQGSTTTVFVAVSDFLSVTNATVTGALGNGPTNIIFKNDGKAPDATAGDNIYSAAIQLPTNATSITLTLIATAPAPEVGVTNTIVYTLTPPPPNDLFVNATKIPAQGTAGVPITSNNKFATTEVGEPMHANTPSVASLWWNYSSSVDANVLVDTAGSTFDTVIGVYTGNTVNKLTKIAAVDDVGSKKQGYLIFPATAATTYHIAIAGASANQVGSIRLRVEPGGQPDGIAPVVTITNISGTSVTNAVIQVGGTAIDPQPNASGVSAVLVKVNNQISKTAFGTTNWYSGILLAAGTNTIQVSAIDFAGNTSLPHSISLYYQPGNAPNDLFVNATALVGTNGVVSGSNTNATKEFNEPAHAGNVGGKSVWWSFQAPVDGVLFLSTTNSSFDTLLGIYTGTQVGALTTIGSNDDAFPGSGFSKITQGIRGGQTYWIAVDGYNGVSGKISLTYSFTPATLYTLTVASGLGGTATPTSGLFSNNTTVVVTAIPNQNFDFGSWSGSVSSFDNPLSVVVHGNMTLTPQFIAHQFSDDFETGNLSKLAWTTGGDKPWFVQTNVVNGGKFAARSGVIGDSQTSSLFLTAKMRAGVGAFDYRVSSENGWDFLEFYVNGTLINRWSGEVAWSTYAFGVLDGLNTMEWRYRKDPLNSAGLDAAFIDNVDLPLIVPVGPSSAAHLGLSISAEGGLSIRVTGQPGQQYLIQASDNLTQWQSISTNLAVDGIIQFVDPDAAGKALRFYRAVVPGNQ